LHSDQHIHVGTGVQADKTDKNKIIIYLNDHSGEIGGDFLKVIKINEQMKMTVDLNLKSSRSIPSLTSGLEQPN
jgi:hypothetical protein